MRHLIACLIALPLLLAGCDAPWFSFGQSPPSRPSQVASLPSQFPRIPDILSVPPENMRQALAEAYRLRPDKRFLLAIGEIYHLLTGEPRTSAAIEFRDSKWQIRYADAEVGALPAFPNFPDLIAILSDWARRVNDAYPQGFSSTGSASPTAEFDSQIDRFAARELFAALRQMDRAWSSGRRDAALLPPATRALVLLALQTLDRAEMGDELPAKALALLTITKVLTNHAAVREESLLARTMGYTGHAATLASSLPPSDAVRLYLTGDDQRLKAVAEAPECPIETRYLWMLRLGELKDVKGFYSLLGKFFRQPEFILPGVKAGLEMHDFGTNRSLSERLPDWIHGELAQELGKSTEGWRGIIADTVPRVIVGALYLVDGLVRQALGMEPPGPSALVHRAARVISDLFAQVFGTRLSRLIARFDADVEAAAGKNTGPFLDPETYRAYYRDFFYSGLFVQGLHYMDSLSSVDAVRRFAGELGKAEKGTAADFQRWYRHLAEFKGQNADPRVMHDDLGELRHLGAPALRRSFDELQRRMSYGDPMGFTAAKWLAWRMDTRVEDRLSFAVVAYSGLRDLALVENLHRSAFEAAPSSWYTVWYANFTGNQRLQLELLRWPSLKPDTRAEILGHVEKQRGVSAEFLRGEYRRLMKEDPGNWKVRSKYVDYLERVKDYAEARSVIDEWLETHDESAGFDHIFAHTALARIYYREEKYEEGWEAVEPVVDSWQAGAMEWAARLLDKLDRADDAEAMGRRVVSRYPDSARSRALLVGMYWRHGKNAEAARLLKTAPRDMSVYDWQHIVGPRFAEVFKDRPDAALAAFAVLLAEGLDHYNLESLPYPMGKAGKPELAFRMASQLHSHGLGQIEIFIHSYQYLKDWRGKEIALEWLRKNVPAPTLNPSSMVIFSLGEFELLWDLIENPEQGSHADAVWLMRAAASAKMGPSKDPHRDALLKYYSNPGGSHYHALGRFLLGLQTEREVLAQATDAKKRCEIAFYTGLRAQADGRYTDASDWYRVTVETGQERNGEYRWAMDTLYRWVGEGKSLSRLAAEKL